MKIFSLVSLAFILFAFSSEGKSASSLEKESVMIGEAVFSLEIAQTPLQLRRGLMHRKHLGTQSGMLFLFPKVGKYCFWMKNTLIPLDLLLLDSQGTVVQIIKDMSPGSLKHQCAEKTIAGAIEVSSGTVEKYKLKSGMVVPLKSFRARSLRWKKE